MHTSDLTIPTPAAIVLAAIDYRASAARLKDDAAARQLDRLIENVLHGARLRWELGTLHVGSPSGGCYQVSAAGCSCPNGAAGRAECWHRALFHLLLEMLDDQAAIGDLLADAAEWRAEAEMRHNLSQRIAAARSQCWV